MESIGGDSIFIGNYLNNPHRSYYSYPFQDILRLNLLSVKNA